MAKFTICVLLFIIAVLSRNTEVLTINLPTGCDDAQPGQPEHFACGSEISSQFLAPDGSVITDSRGSTFSSDGIKKTFHELKKEADNFVSKTNQHGASFSSGSYSEHQVGGSGQLQQHFQLIPQSSKVTTVHKEQQVEKKVYSSKGSTSNSNSGTFGVSPIGDHSDVHVVYTPPVKVYEYVVPAVENGGNVKKSYEFQHSSETVKTTNPGVSHVVEKLQVPIDAASVSESSHQTYESGNQQQQVAGSNQPSFAPNIEPNTFTTGVLDFGHQFQIEHSMSPVSSIHVRLPHIKDTKEQHYNTAQSNVQKEYRFPAESLVKPSNPIRFPDEDNNHLNADEFNSKQALNHAYSKNQNEFSQTVVGTAANSDSGLPTSRLVIKVKAPVVGTSQVTEDKSIISQSQTVSSKSQPLPLDASLLNAADSHYISQFASSRFQNPASLDSSRTKEAGTSSQTYYVPSPVLLGGVPQTVPLEKQTENGASGYYYSSSSYGGTSGSGSVPILVQGVPQTLEASNQKLTSSGDGSQFYTSGSEPLYNQKTSSSSSSSHFYSKGSEPLFSNSDYFLGQGDTNILHTGSSAFDKSSSHHAHSNGALCSVCTGDHTIISGQPVKSSYGISTSFSSSSSNVNGKKTENRAASVLVNDNGKIDSYNVKS